MRPGDIVLRLEDDFVCEVILICVAEDDLVGAPVKISSVRPSRDDMHSSGCRGDPPRPKTSPRKLAALVTGSAAGSSCES